MCCEKVFPVDPLPVPLDCDAPIVRVFAAQMELFRGVRYTLCVKNSKEKIRPPESSPLAGPQPPRREKQAALLGKTSEDAAGYL
jgi:hypothetical protein